MAGGASGGRTLVGATGIKADGNGQAQCTIGRVGLQDFHVSFSKETALRQPIASRSDSAIGASARKRTASSVGSNG